MTRALSLEPRLIERFLQTLHFHHPVTPKNYACTLRNFSAFLVKHGAGARLTVSIVQQWLKERSLTWRPTKRVTRSSTPPAMGP